MLSCYIYLCCVASLTLELTWSALLSWELLRLTLVGTELMKLFLRLRTESVEPLFGVRPLFSY